MISFCYISFPFLFSLSCVVLSNKLYDVLMIYTSLSVGSNGEEHGRAERRSTLLDGSSKFVLTYEDKDGDWMLVGDVPWGYVLGS